MAELTIAAAARAAGVARSTIQRAINTGRLSKLPSGLIDTAELERVYPLQGDGAVIDAASLQDAAVGADLIEVERDEWDALQREAAALRAERDATRQAQEDLRQERERLWELVKSQARLLEAAPTQKIGVVRQAWDWLFGPPPGKS